MKNFTLLRIIDEDCFPYNHLIQNNPSSLDSYEKFLTLCRKQMLLYPSSFAPSFEKVGSRVIDVLVRFFPSQKLWADQMGFTSYSERDWKKSIFLQQIAHYKPDVIYCERGGAFYSFEKSFFQDLKKRFPFIKVLTGYWGTSSPLKDHFSPWDFVFTMNSFFVKDFQEKNIPAYISHHCFEPTLWDLEKKSEVRDLDFVFAGVTGFGYPDHYLRYKELSYLLERTPLKLFAEERDFFSVKEQVRMHLLAILSKFPAKVLSAGEQACKKTVPLASRLFRDGKTFERNPFYKEVPLKKKFAEKTFPGVFGLDYFSLLQRSKIVLNRHVDRLDNYGNMRMFEVTGMESCLLTDRGNFMGHLFTPDEEMVSYSSVEECVEKANYLIQHPKVAQDIGRKGFLRVQKEHTFFHRAPFLHNTIAGYL